MGKYFWGDDIFPLSIWALLQFILAPVLVGVVVDCQHGGKSGFGSTDYKEIIVATIGFCVLQYIHVFTQVACNLNEAGEEEKNIALRAMMNTLEQSFLFLVPLWLYGIFINAEIAGVLGKLYLAFRAIYSFSYGYYGGFTVIVEISTTVGYVITYYLMSELLLVHQFGFNFIQYSTENLPLGLIAMFFISTIAQTLIINIPANILAGNMTRGVAWEKAYESKKK